MKRGKAGTMTFDDKRHGITRCSRFERARRHGARARMQRHRHQEFIRFLNAIERAVPAGKVIHVILDNYATHKHLKVRAGWAANRASSSTSRRLHVPG